MKTHALKIEDSSSTLYRAPKKVKPSRDRIPQNKKNASKKSKNQKKVYSLRIDSHGQDLSKEQQEFFKDSKIRDKEGRLRVVYHGTNDTEFNIFDESYIGTASGDDGFFGRGFYFAYSRGEASYYGSKRIIPAYINVKNPFNFRAELGTYNGEEAKYGYAPDAVRLLNFAEKFPEIAKDEKISVARHGSDDIEEISLEEFAKEFKNVIENKKFTRSTVKNQLGEEETLVTADEREGEYEYEGKKETYLELDVEIKGHAGAGSYGNDVVCAGVYIMKHCPNVKAIIRHWDVTGKECPSLYRGTHNVMWEELLKEVSPFPVEVSDENEIAEPTLKKGDKGTQVSILQKNLNTAGCCGKDGKGLEIDGDFGVNTEYALKLLQKGRGITSDGVYGQKSYEAMKAALK